MLSSVIYIDLTISFECFLNRMLDLLEALLCMEALFPI